MSIQWYPGHMVKTKRQIIDSLKLIDVVIELFDARIPDSSKNPDIDELIGNKQRVVLLNKCEMADENITKEWIKRYKDMGISALDVDSITGRNINRVYTLVKESVKEHFEKRVEKGIVGRPVRALVLGIPNVGKSTFINKISSKSSAKTGDKPGVTRSKQWIKVNKDFELLDTPGILWPKFDDEKVALHLAFIRAIKDEILDPEELAVKLIEELVSLKPEALKDRYKIDLNTDAFEVLKNIGRKRGCIVSGGEVNTVRAANLLLDDFRSGRLGRLSLEKPQI
ncbi:ribosome biogenesis GTPase YlqF [Fonticella tunisiensis]|nr:ribosome biogenesis GTPase YlqF [Fonticella tunisiensis]